MMEEEVAEAAATSVFLACGGRGSGLEYPGGGGGDVDVADTVSSLVGSASRRSAEASHGDAAAPSDIVAPCPNCSRPVPALNMTLHLATDCGRHNHHCGGPHRGDGGGCVGADGHRRGSRQAGSGSPRFKEGFQNGDDGEDGDGIGGAARRMERVSLKRDSPTSDCRDGGLHRGDAASSVGAVLASSSSSSSDSVPRECSGRAGGGGGAATPTGAESSSFDYDDVSSPARARPRIGRGPSASRTSSGDAWAAGGHPPPCSGGSTRVLSERGQASSAASLSSADWEVATAAGITKGCPSERGGERGGLAALVPALPLVDTSGSGLHSSSSRGAESVSSKHPPPQAMAVGATGMQSLNAIAAQPQPASVPHVLMRGVGAGAGGRRPPTGVPTTASSNEEEKAQQSDAASSGGSSSSPPRSDILLTRAPPPPAGATVRSIGSGSFSRGGRSAGGTALAVAVELPAGGAAAASAGEAATVSSSSLPTVGANGCAAIFPSARTHESIAVKPPLLPLLSHAVPVGLVRHMSPSGAVEASSGEAARIVTAGGKKPPARFEGSPLPPGACNGSHGLASAIAHKPPPAQDHAEAGARSKDPRIPQLQGNVGNSPGPYPNTARCPETIAAKPPPTSHAIAAKPAPPPPPPPHAMLSTSAGCVTPSSSSFASSVGRRRLRGGASGKDAVSAHTPSNDASVASGNSRSDGGGDSGTSGRGKPSTSRWGLSKLRSKSSRSFKKGSDRHEDLSASGRKALSWRGAEEAVVTKKKRSLKDRLRNAAGLGRSQAMRERSDWLDAMEAATGQGDVVVDEEASCTSSEGGYPPRGASEDVLSATGAREEDGGAATKTTVRQRMLNAAGVGRSRASRGSDWLDAMEAATGQGDVVLDLDASGSSSEEDEEAMEAATGQGDVVLDSDASDSSFEEDEEAAEVAAAIAAVAAMEAAESNSGGAAKETGLEQVLEAAASLRSQTARDSNRLDAMEAVTGQGDVVLDSDASCTSEEESQGLSACEDDDVEKTASGPAEAEGGGVVGDLLSRAINAGTGACVSLMPRDCTCLDEEEAPFEESGTRLDPDASFSSDEGVLRDAAVAEGEDLGAKGSGEAEKKKKGIKARLKDAAGIGRSQASRKDDWLDAMDAATGQGDVFLDDNASCSSSAADEEDIADGAAAGLFQRRQDCNRPDTVESGTGKGDLGLDLDGVSSSGEESASSGEEVMPDSTAAEADHYDEKQEAPDESGKKKKKKKGIKARLKDAAGIGRSQASRKDDWLDAMDAATGQGDVFLDDNASCSSSAADEEDIVDGAAADLFQRQQDRNWPDSVESGTGQGDVELDLDGVSSSGEEVMLDSTAAEADHDDEKQEVQIPDESEKKKKKGIKARLKDAAGIGRSQASRKDGWLDAMDAATGQGDVLLDENASSSSSEEEEVVEVLPTRANAIASVDLSLNPRDCDRVDSIDAVTGRGDVELDPDVASSSEEELPQDATAAVEAEDHNGKQEVQVPDEAGKKKKKGIKARLKDAAGIGRSQASRKEDWLDAMDAATGQGDVFLDDASCSSSSVDKEEEAGVSMGREALRFSSARSHATGIVVQPQEPQDAGLSNTTGGTTSNVERVSDNGEVELESERSANQQAEESGRGAQKIKKKKSLRKRFRNAAGIGRSQASRRDDWLDAMEAATGQGDVVLDADASSSEDEVQEVRRVAADVEVVNLADDSSSADDSSLDGSDDIQHIDCDDDDSIDEEMSTSTDDGEEEDEEEEWPCPRCTLLNSPKKSQCDACQYQNEEVEEKIAAELVLRERRRRERLARRADAEAEAALAGADVRPPDPIRTERLIDLGGSDDDDGSDGVIAYAGAPGPSVGGGNANIGRVSEGAILGSVVGAASAHVGGDRSMGSEAQGGAVGGAIGGALMGEAVPLIGGTVGGIPGGGAYIAVPPGSSEAEAYASAARARQTARQTHALGLPSSTGGGGSSASMSMTLPSYGPDGQLLGQTRIERVSNGRGGYVTRTFATGASTGGVMLGGSRNNMAEAIMRSMILGAGGRVGGTNLPTGVSLGGVVPPGAGAGLGGAQLSPVQGQAGVEGMSYEQLLNAFGDGSENRGADPAIISSLPTATIDDVERELPEDRRQCSICLEDFTKGNKRKTLPCLHGFHEECVDRWLQANATCPVCKHSLED